MLRLKLSLALGHLDFVQTFWWDWQTCCTWILNTYMYFILSLFQSKFYPYSKTIYLPNPSWPNHAPVFRHGGLEVKTYRHYDAPTCGFDAAGCYDDLSVGHMAVTWLVAMLHTLFSFYAEIAREIDCTLPRLCAQSNRSWSHGKHS